MKRKDSRMLLPKWDISVTHPPPEAPGLWWKKGCKVLRVRVAYGKETVSSEHIRAAARMNSHMVETTSIQSQHGKGSKTKYPPWPRRN